MTDYQPHAMMIFFLPGLLSFPIKDCACMCFHLILLLLHFLHTGCPPCRHCPCFSLPLKASLKQPNAYNLGRTDERAASLYFHLWHHVAVFFHGYSICFTWFSALFSSAIFHFKGTLFPGLAKKRTDKLVNRKHPQQPSTTSRRTDVAFITSLFRKNILGTGNFSGDA